VLNVHERTLPAAPADVGGLIRSLSSEHDALWPRSRWPAMTFDRPLGLNAAGGHGPIRYVVQEIQKDLIRFRFTAPKGFNGYHGFEVLPLSERETILRHALDMNAEGLAVLSWPLLYRPLHDALIEDSLACAEESLGLQPQIRPWSPWVRFLRWLLSRARTRRQPIPKPTSKNN